MRACILSVCLNEGQLIANFQFDMHEMLTLHMLICALANSTWMQYDWYSPVMHNS